LALVVRQELVAALVALAAILYLVHPPLLRQLVVALAVDLIQLKQVVMAVLVVVVDWAEARLEQAALEIRQAQLQAKEIMVVMDMTLAQMQVMLVVVVEALVLLVLLLRPLLAGTEALG
jgi:hypothetical protein